MGTHLRVLSKSYPMNTNMVFKNLCILVLRTEVAFALEGLGDGLITVGFRIIVALFG